MTGGIIFLTGMTGRRSPMTGGMTGMTGGMTGMTGGLHFLTGMTGRKLCGVQISSIFLPFPLPPLGSEKRKALLEEIEKMKEKEAVVPVEPGTPGFYCNLFSVTKVTGGFRPVINLKPLNKMTINPSFKMETASSII